MHIIKKSRQTERQQPDQQPARETDTNLTNKIQLTTSA